MARLLIIGPLTLPDWATLELTQVYLPDDNENDERMADRSLRWQALGPPKIETEIRCRGTVPPSLEALLATGDAHMLSCVSPRGVFGGTNIELPAARRTDAGSVPHGRAFVRQKVVWTPCAMLGNTAQLTEVDDAHIYQALYYPKFLAKIRLGNVSQPQGRMFSWSLTAREV